MKRADSVISSEDAHFHSGHSEVIPKSQIGDTVAAMAVLVVSRTMMVGPEQELLYLTR